MRTYELKVLLEEVMREKGLGSKEITLIKGGDIADVVWCENCDKFHIVLT